MNVEALLKRYNIKLSSPNLEKIAGGLGGSAYLLSGNKDKNKYIIKVVTKSEVKKIQFEAEYISFLNRQSVPATEIICNNLGGLVSEDNGKFYYLCHYLEGEPVSGKLSGSVLTSHIAKYISQLHLVSSRFSPIYQASYDGYSDACKNFQHSENKRIRLIVEKIEEVAQKLHLARCPKSAIHGDITRENLLLNRSSMTIAGLIDFSDCHCDYIVWDLSIVITHLFITKTYGVDWDGIKRFYNIYNNQRPIMHNESINIVPMMIIRNLSIAAEVANLLQNGSNDVSIEKLESILNSVEQKIKLIEQNKPKLEEIFVRS